MAQLANYDDDKGNVQLFLQNFIDTSLDEDTFPKYMQILQEVANRERRIVLIELNDVEAFVDSSEDESLKNLVENIEGNCKRYQYLFSEVIDDILPRATEAAEPDVADILALHRGQRTQDASTGAQVPKALLRRYDVYFKPRSKMDRTHLRSVTSQHIGCLVKLRGIVTHVTDVKPLIEVVTYTDQENGNEVYQEVSGRSFMPIETTEQYKKSKIAPVMETRGSKFCKFQEARIQEMADEVPEGATPRTISVHLKGEICRSMKAGDVVVLTGVFLPEPVQGFRAMRAGLLTTTYVLAQDVEQVKTSYSQHVLTERHAEVLTQLAEEGDVYGRLSRSIAPEIFGMEDVKKALLLLMVGGATRHLKDGMKLRGDVHLCLMGDPGVAKSQLLKYVSRVSPRAVYTTGKGSSGVGLTAAVLRNQVTKELVLEGGALVLADRGICCIDEFDKMEEADRTAIHEVMEQQTVSIAKAGITTTLNTRTTILAAANPAWGRYDKRRSPAENINLPAALLSRFDLLWLLLDESSVEGDRRLAHHILNVHMHGEAPQQEGAPPIAPEVLRVYIAQAKQYTPHIPTDLTDYLAAIYAEMRQLEKSQMEVSSTYTTPRTLLSIIRVAMALAKLRFDTQVIQSDVDEALRLMRMSKASLNSDVELQRRDDPVSICYRLIKEEAMRMVSSGKSSSDATAVTFSRIQELTAKHNLSRDDILQCLEEYANIAVWIVQEDAEGNPVVHVPVQDAMEI
ncbi:hypothetical protein CEUSTIGMA_g10025.t1 [Chlamydomonas eustigma]|uniref:DNA replication licensing factor MCM7 n=1 Tax=Chlamydomonas eustigma TaxID=1157962 RepID=A0A250XI55_9CHLO|nr:hypothetical protein CEUSTIGMA_g10025.t1 [Chlamydomonas eustigma]|eukprot:GAX82599.1 hypothetical protein CEUSTIGMA_g10025.t1 [Chlamydomonas eustigma]